NTWVGNLCEDVWLAAESEDLEGQTFNIRDPRLVSKREFVETICDAAGLTKPAKVVPLPVAKAIATGMETIWKLLGKKQAPLLNMARIKFLGLNLDFSIDRAGYQLGYDPATDFRTAMPSAVASLAEQGGPES
ncbi:MAG: oxidoreductase, partial [Planctomycetaceae bacterium]